MQKEYIDITEFLCSTDGCIEKIKAGLLHKKNELFNDYLGRSEGISIGNNVRHIFFNGNFYCKDGKLCAYLYDELDPELIIDYTISINQYKSERQYVYEYVCRIQQKIVNDFYKELEDYRTNGALIIHNSKVFMNSTSDKKWSMSDFTTAYSEALDRRLLTPYKRIRA